MALSQEVINFLTPAQAQRYRTLEKLFDSDGWKIVETFAQASIDEQLARAANAQNWETHRLATGARAAFTQLLNLRQTTELEFEALAEQASEAVTLIEEEKFE